MNPEDNILLAATRQTLSTTHRHMISDTARRRPIDWTTVYQTAKTHGVAPLVFKNLQQCGLESPGLPDEVAHQFKSAHYSNLLKKDRRMERLKQAMPLFRRKNIQVMLIKGAALDMLVYEQPWYTMPQDTDLVINRRQSDIAAADNQELMDFLFRSGIEYDYFEHHDVVMNGVLPVDFNQIWQAATQTEVGGYPAFLMSVEDMLLATCINSCRKRFFRLKSLCDIAEITRRCHTLDWDKFVKRAKAFQCRNIVYTALWVAHNTLGTATPPTVFSDLGVAPLKAEIITRLSRRLIRRSTLAALYPSSGAAIFGRAAGLPLWLTYATYTGPQIIKKTAEIYRARAR